VRKGLFLCWDKPFGKSLGPSISPEGPSMAPWVFAPSALNFFVIQAKKILYFLAYMKNFSYLCIMKIRWIFGENFFY